MYQKQFSRACYLMLIVTLCCSGRMRNRSRSTLPSWARSLIPLELPCRMLPLLLVSGQRYIGFFAGGKLKNIEASGGPP
jgi:hypothetical protein